MAKSAATLTKSEVEELRKDSLSFRLSPHALSFEDFERFVFYVRRLIGDVSYAVSRDYGGWILTGLSFGSAGVNTAPASLNGETRLVEDAIVEGLRTLQHGGEVPNYYSERALRYARMIVKLARAEEVVVTGPRSEPVTLRAEAGTNITRLLTTRHRYFGSVVGDLDAVSVHRGIKATLYGEEGRVVACSLTRSLLNDVKELLGTRVLAVGEVSANGTGGVIGLRAEEIFASPRPVKLPGVSALFGALPDLTDGSSSDTYVRGLWGVD